MLEFIKNAVLVIMGFIAGSSVMYFFEVYMDWREERDHEIWSD